MEQHNSHFSCQVCGKVTECLPGMMPCKALRGWLTVSFWEGPGEVKDYNFCSFSCLESWAKAQMPDVPEIFLKAFREDKANQG